MYELLNCFDCTIVNTYILSPQYTGHLYKNHKSVFVPIICWDGRD